MLLKLKSDAPDVNKPSHLLNSPVAAAERMVMQHIVANAEKSYIKRIRNTFWLRRRNMDARTKRPFVNVAASITLSAKTKSMLTDENNILRTKPIFLRHDVIATLLMLNIERKESDRLNNIVKKIRKRSKRPRKNITPKIRIGSISNHVFMPKTTERKYQNRNISDTEMIQNIGLKN